MDRSILKAVDMAVQVLFQDSLSTMVQRGNLIFFRAASIRVLPEWLLAPYRGVLESSEFINHQ